MLISHSLVSSPVEECLTPRVTNGTLQGCALDSMLNISINLLTIDIAAIVHLIVLKLEHMAIDNRIAIFLENLEQDGLVLRVNLRVELTKSQEIFTIDTMVLLVLESESSHVKASLGGLDATTQPRFVLIDRDQINTSVRVLPETTKHALHVTSSNTNIQ